MIPKASKILKKDNNLEKIKEKFLHNQNITFKTKENDEISISSKSSKKTLKPINKSSITSTIKPSEVKINRQTTGSIGNILLGKLKSNQIQSTEKEFTKKSQNNNKSLCNLLKLDNKLDIKGMSNVNQHEIHFDSVIKNQIEDDLLEMNLLLEELKLQHFKERFISNKILSNNAQI